MKRTFNFTGRKKIGRSHVSIDLIDDGRGDPRFDCRVDLGDVGLPGSSAVYLEAYSRFAFRRFPYGTIDRITPPDDRTLPEFQGSPLIRFRLKVIDETSEHGRILAVADGVTPRDPEADQENRMPILPVEATDLQDAVWKVDFEQGGPVLAVNRHIENIYGIVGSDPTFQALVFPEAVRRVLEWIVRPGSDPDPWGDIDEWETRWLRYAMRFNSSEPPGGEDKTDDQRTEWIDAVVAGFCKWLGARQNFEAANRADGDGT
ncbi:MAG: hypothetical protein ACX98W_01465 [bacterium]